MTRAGSKASPEALVRAVELYSAGKSLRAAGAATGINREVLRNHLEESGLSRRPRLYVATLDLKERVRRSVAINPDTGCWECFIGHHDFGYGVLRVGCKNDVAHRWSWRAFKGPIPAGLYVLHRCDNPPCCNPDHLFLGTQLDNMRDAAAKGRTRSGSVRRIA